MGARRALPERQVPTYLGRILNDRAQPVGTCFQIAPTLLVTAGHVLSAIGVSQVGASVVIEPLGGGRSFDGTLAVIDPEHDLAVIVSAVSLRTSVRLGDTDKVGLRERVSVIGNSTLHDGKYTYRYLTATGEWAGTTLRSDGVRLGSMTANRITLGMSGAPVILDAQGIAVGVVSGRYNSGEEWFVDNVWVVHTADVLRAISAVENTRSHAVAAVHGVPDDDGEVAPEAPVIRWVHDAVRPEYFAGRSTEIVLLERWCGNLDVRLIGVTAWGGAGKTALVAEFMRRYEFMDGRRFDGLFGWSFYEDPSVENWGRGLVSWVASEFDLRPKSTQLARQILEVLAALPLILVLDGLEVLQEGPGDKTFGRFLDGTLRAVLTGHCLLHASSLVVLTSRFPFEDLENFDGGAARMLDVPPLEVGEGVNLLRLGGATWLGTNQLADLVKLVDGHALAVVTLSAALQERLPTADLHSLKLELAAAQRTDARVAKVISFYGSRLAEADRTLVAIVSLFQRPVQAAAVLSLGSHPSFGAALAGWTAADAETACRQRLAGLVSWHGHGFISAHPLVRDAFRATILSGETAQLASEVTLQSLPSGPVTTVEEARRIVEIIELLIDSEQPRVAYELYRSRTVNGRVWLQLPAAQLGQRCAAAFLRKLSPEKTLPEAQLGFFSNEVGLLSVHVGDTEGATVALQEAIDRYRALGSLDAHAIAVRNLTRCFVAAGDAAQAIAAARESLALAQRIKRPSQIKNARSHLAAALDLSGETYQARREFEAANRIQEAQYGRGLFTADGSWLADLLLRTGAVAEARRLSLENLEVCRSHGWHADEARYRRLLGKCDLVNDRLHDATGHLEAAIDIFRDGDYLSELADALPDLADCYRRDGLLDQAELHCTDSIVTLAGPRQLLPALARSLAMRATVRADQYRATRNDEHLAAARDDATHCLRIATKIRRLPWLELLGYGAHAAIDDAADADNGWRNREYQLYTQLIGDEPSVSLSV